MKYIEIVGGAQRPAVTLLAPKRTIDKKKLFAKVDLDEQNNVCVSLISTGDDVMRYTSAVAQDGTCTSATSSSETFVSHLRIRKNHSGKALVTVEKVNRFRAMVDGSPVGDLQEVTSTCYYGE